MLATGGRWRACLRETRDAGSKRRAVGRFDRWLGKVNSQTGYAHTVWNGETDDVF